MHTLVVAEKPSVARDIARVLGAGSRGENCLTGPGYVVTWAIGHLVTLKEPQELDERYTKWRAQDLPILPQRMETKVIRKTAAQFKTIKALMNDPQTQDVVCATDSGREGELIFRYIYEKAGCKKPVRRLWISSMTDEAIRAGFDALRPLSDYDALYASARCRADADWLIGMNATRAYTLRYGVLLSVGRVQTPTLSMLVRRRKEIDSFVPQTYYTVRADFGDYHGTYIDAKGEKRIDSLENAQAVAQRASGQAGVVAEAARQRKTELPPQLYDLTTLQREANAQLGFTAKKTLATAQKLYEQHKLITYPRTDSRYLSQDMLGKVQETLEHYDGALEEIGRAALFFGVKMTPRVFDDAKLTDHHAIVPTGRRASGARLSPDERALYDMVAMRLAAAFYPCHEYDALRVVTCVGQDRFLSTGRSVVEEGWKAVYREKAQKRRSAKDEEEQSLPPLSPGDARMCHSAKAKEEKTKPPREHNDASILREMERAGRQIEDEALREQMKDCALGTPATRAAIIERLIEVGYVRRSGRNLLATEKGVRLIEAAPPEIASPETTGRWERALSEIARGSGGEARFREGIARLAAFLVQHAASAPDVSFEKEEYKKRGRGKRGPQDMGVACPLCAKGRMAENTKSFYCTRYREGCRFTIWKNALERSGGPTLSAKLMKLCVEKKDVRGSTGVIHYEGGQIRFTPFGT